MTYIWERDDWPEFRWDSTLVEKQVYAYVKEASSLIGQASLFTSERTTEALVDLMVSEAVKTSQIEGEFFSRKDVRSSILNQLGIRKTIERVRDPGAEGVASLMIAVRDQFREPLTEQRLFEWHSLLMSRPIDRKRLAVGKWRTSTKSMRIISGPMGRKKVHYEAPPSHRVPREMETFIGWFNESKDLKGPIRAGVAHLYFECIHPFDDGNGRIGRALSETALSQDLGSPVLLSLSTTIQAHRRSYYDELSKASRGDLDITEWLVWFTQVILDSQLQAKGQIEFVLKKARFWDHHAEHINKRQVKVLQRMFKEGPKGFSGGITAQKYMKIAACSKATATRDLSDLNTKGCLKRLASGGRSTHYEINL
ncbi:MAG: Fic family protein [Deltaproteobacteria bacterium]|nr:Fic family protein [Deltaproteobacteria bacterium]